MEPRNLAWARRVLSGIVNFNSTQTDQDFNTENDAFYGLDDALTEAYDLELNEAKAKASAEPFKEVASVSWASGASTLELPPYILRNNILEIYDITNNAIGALVHVGRRSAGHAVYWKKQRLLGWGIDGPGEDKTLEFTYVGTGQTFKKPLQEADLIPYDYRWVLTWSAAVILGAKAEQNPPQPWLDKLREWRSSWYSAMSHGSPQHQNVPRIHNHRRRR